ncbi:hypothetical protein A9255_14025 [Xenorhabdus hominickii]|uniref:DUF805 domain-containing protein n=1 Tax=Xenorhabdus hominickii TaxID=351679 RepID=A0ABM6DU88_XENHO|nr:hypothetical protein A9255_14025 [Xenorhabdus hominickii]
MALAGVYGVFILIPQIAVTVRRLHDTNHSGWWLLLNLIPFGGLVVFIFILLEGSEGSNDYGADPKGMR